MVHLPEGHAAEAFIDAISPLLAVLPPSARLSLTWDQGSEMARHDLLAPHFSDGVYFARPGSPWLRGTNENTNGLLRQYFPKGTDLRRFTAADLARVEHLLNHRPRRVLGWRTPALVFAERLQS